MSGHQDFESALSAAGAGVGAAECHGFLCGQLCSPHFPAEELWQEFLDLRTLDVARAEACHEHVRQLLYESRRQLASEEFDFQMLLPDDDTGMPERVQALAGWCRGFLSGLGLVEDLPARVLGDGIQEWLRDMDVISRVGVDEPDEEDETALMQVMEHVRTGVMLIREEMRMYGIDMDQETLQ
ncbi:MAG: hypothetical protein A3H91_03875 [Gammaproteobacteria bacterium RIFCSPLOWO2_02_FULL_61_13]|nr:MAG: hypothetical protein A3H91_03875 [Gammaproteobacteria bacterium RIFCSPLOWO2_02_FULL_61_13]